jgi:hypothetical protein
MKTWLACSLAVAALFSAGCEASVTVQEPVNEPKPEPRPEPKPEPEPEPKPEPKACTKIGCSSSLDVTFNPGKVGFAKGTYTIEAEADGKKGQCETKLPLPACLKEGVKAGLNTRCSGDLPLTLEQPPCAEKDAPPTLGVLKIGDAPKGVKVKVINNKKPYGEQTISPKYKESRPNGPECDPVCKQGTEEMCLGKCAE